MTRHTERLWRAVLLDEEGRAKSFVLYAVDADAAMNEAEHMTGMECVLVDDVTPERKKAA